MPKPAIGHDPEPVPATSHRFALFIHTTFLIIICCSFDTANQQDRYYTTKKQRTIPCTALNIDLHYIKKSNQFADLNDTHILCNFPIYSLTNYSEKFGKIFLNFHGNQQLYWRDRTTFKFVRHISVYSQYLIS